VEDENSDSEDADDGGRMEVDQSEGKKKGLGPSADEEGGDAKNLRKKRRKEKKDRKKKGELPNSVGDQEEGDKKRKSEKSKKHKDSG
jgi:hypothetical protein